MNPGTKVTYIGNPYKGPEKGIVKSLSQDRKRAFVVFNCGNQWDRYQDYTAASCSLDDLVEGWEEHKNNQNEAI